MLSQNALVVVADGQSAILFRNTARYGVELTEAAKLTPQDLDQEPPGAVTDEGSVNEDEDTAFAAQLADHLNALALKHKFEDLAIIADPATLGIMRKRYHKELQYRLRKELAKNLTNSDVKAIEGALA